MKCDKGCPGERLNAATCADGAARSPVVVPRQRPKPLGLGAYRQSRTEWSLPEPTGEPVQPGIYELK